jgi:hypothetical protein
MNRYLRLLFVLFAHAAFAQPVTLIESPVKVTAEAQKDARIESGTTALTIEVVDRNQAFRFQVFQRGSEAEAIARQKASTGFKDGFLFIRDDCLAGNPEKKSWRCVLDKVFAWAESSAGKRLIYVGDVHAGEECEAGAKVGCAHYDGHFTDIYDLMETNALASAAAAPAIYIEMTIKSGEFAVDLDDTWGRNQERYKAGALCLAAAPEARAMHCIDGLTPRRAYMFNAALAAYTKRESELDRTRMHARSALCDNVPEAECSDTLRASALILARITPGAKPKNRGVVRAYRLNESNAPQK